MNNENFFVLAYESGENGCPPRLSGEFNDPDSEFEWSTFEPDPKNIVINKSYEFNATDRTVKDLSFDYYASQTPIVSDDFLSVCEGLGVEYRAIPLKMIIRKMAWTKKKYYLFLPCTSEALLDPGKSEFMEEQDREIGGVKMNRIFPNKQTPVYSWIKHFHVLPSPFHLFHCIELFEVVVSEKFKEQAMVMGLKGLKFIPLDCTFRYDPWDEL